MPKDNSFNDEHHHERHTQTTIFKIIIPLIFLASGISLLALRIPGWSIIIGLPAIVFGVVFLLYTYDELVSNTVRPLPKNTLSCSVCGKPTPRLYPWADPKDAVCYSCKVDANKKKKINK